MTAVRVDDRTIALPGIASAHSHAFQRALRGRTHRARGSFWSWRGLMYELANRLGPDEIYALSRFAFIELASAGVTSVGEFHYVHHRPDGSRYAVRTELADAVIRAALDAGLRIALLRVLYARGGFGREADPSQRRFCDPDVDDALADVDALRARYAGDPRVAVGVAPHSVRAVPVRWIEAAAQHAATHSLPLHMHVSEQRREVQECLAEHGVRPVELLAARGVLGPRFVGVHATHLAQSEIAALGAARSFACVCRTTERDLGDGLPPLGPLLEAGARLCFGTDSHAISDPFEEARAAELDERTRVQRRVAATDADALLEASTAGGHAALGLDATGDRVLLDAQAPELSGAPADALADAVVFGANPRCVRHVSVAGRTIVEQGRHVAFDEARLDYERTIRALGL